MGLVMKNWCWKEKIVFAVTLMFVVLVAYEPPRPAYAVEEGFSVWLQQFKQQAIKQGISSTTIDKAFAGLVPNSRVVELDRKQPETTMSFTTYMQKVVNDKRVQQGRRLYRKHRQLLYRIGARYGVQPRFIIALWGIETNYGSNMGGFNIIQALATLAYDGRRSEFFREELLNALRIIDAGHISLTSFKGSWAGAMGQTQFMPSSFLSYAVDYDGDGRKDIWHSLPDIFASIANYLHNTGWDNKTTWGRRVTLPPNFPEDMLGLKIRKTLPEWQKLGVRRADGGDLPKRSDVVASVILADKAGRYPYLVYDNFNRILKWNRSKYFAIAVGRLADKIAARK